MKNNFQIKAIDTSRVNHLFDLNDQDLAKMNAIKKTVTAKPGFPCRVSLEDAEVGEEVILFSYDPFNIDSPYQTQSPIFVRINAKTAKLGVNEIPRMLQHRTQSLRAFDNSGMMLDARTINGKEVSEHLKNLFLNQDILFIHIHNSGPGCFNCQVDRVA